MTRLFTEARCSARYGLLFLLWWSAFSPQGRANGQSAAAATGTVTGHVICSDTQGPARMAHVVLQAVPDAKAPASGKGKEEPKAQNVTLTPTALNGSFVIAHVRPAGIT